jgi:hypothetical protein
MANSRTGKGMNTPPSPSTPVRAGPHLKGRSDHHVEVVGAGQEAPTAKGHHCGQPEPVQPEAQGPKALTKKNSDWL